MVFTYNRVTNANIGSIPRRGIFDPRNSSNKPSNCKRRFQTYSAHTHTLMTPTPEALARENIDAQLSACGWCVQDRARMNLYAGRGVAVREVLWIYDLRTYINFLLKTNPLIRANLGDFVKRYHTENRHKRFESWSPKNPEGCWRVYPYEDIAGRVKVNLDIFWLRDLSLEDSANLPGPDVLAAEILEDLKSTLDMCKWIAIN